MNYQESLDYIFKTYMQIQSKVNGLKYRDYKNIQIIGNILKELNLLPSPEKVIKVTGSKGKGTTSRSLAAILQEESQQDIGLFISPEEHCHNDRIAINEEIISRESFTNILCELIPTLERHAKNFQELDYYSPYGIFLIIALKYFKQRNVKYIILECGRGVRYDDSNSVPGNIGIITSIFPEHLSYFGESIKDVFKDKIAIAETSKEVLLHKSLNSYDLPKNSRLIDHQLEIDTGLPSPYLESFKLALASAEHILNRNIKFKTHYARTTSYGETKIDNVTVFYDAVISETALDKKWLKNRAQALFYISLPDDKNLEAFLSVFNKLTIEIKLIILTGKRGYLDYGKSLNKDALTYHYEDISILDDALAQARNHEEIVFLGTQTFIRNIKLGIEKRFN